jgi:hypothetical protein
MLCAPYRSKVVVIAGRIAVACDPEYAAGTMAAYAVIARIGRVDPHLTLRDLDEDLRHDGSDGGLPSDSPALAVDVVRAPEPGPIAEWFRRARELWTQTTFYVFDADSWRT